VDRLQAIFDASTQETVGTQRQYGGIGLGTSISRELVHLMGGQIEAQSPNPNNAYDTRGARFVFDVRLERATAQEDQARQDPIERVRALNRVEQRRLLVAEDDRINQMLMRRFLDLMVFSFQIFNDGAELQAAVEAGAAGHFDCVLLDSNMPTMDGPETAAALRRHGVSVPIISVTANTMAADIHHALEAGMDDVIHKPIALERLAPSLARWTSDQARASVIPAER
jgi:CheY-like chemotaxis protein